MYNDPAKLSGPYARGEVEHLADETPPYNALVAADEPPGFGVKDPEK